MSDKGQIQLILSDISTSFSQLAHSFDELARFGFDITGDHHIASDVTETATEVAPEQDDPETKRLFELQEMDLRSLKKLAISYGYDRQDVAAADKDTLIDGILSEELSEQNEVEPETEQAEDAPQELTREDILGMGLDKAKKLALSKGMSQDQLTGLDVDGIASLLIDGEDINNPDEYKEVTESDFEDLNKEQLREMLTSLGVVVKGQPKRETLIKMLVSANQS